MEEINTIEDILKLPYNDRLRIMTKIVKNNPSMIAAMLLEDAEKEIEDIEKEKKKKEKEIMKNEQKKEMLENMLNIIKKLLKMYK